MRRLDQERDLPATSGTPRGAGQDRAPYAEAVAAAAGRGLQRLSVPGHHGDIGRGLAEALGGATVALDMAPLIPGIDIADGAAPGAPSALAEARRLAAAAWGSQDTWFCTNGATQANHTACLALRSLGRNVVVQRTMHSSVMDGMALAGIVPHVVMPSIDRDLGMAHGIAPVDLDRALDQCPEATAAYVVTPSYFGAVSDVRALADVAHAHGIPLVVDEAWGAHLGFHPRLPANALRLGADLVISSTHKLGGSLGQSAMLHLGRGPWAEDLAGHVERALRITSSTSQSSLLLASLDLARRDLACGTEAIGRSIDAADAIRARIGARGRFADVSRAMLADPSVVALDPLRIVIDTRVGGIDGHLARDLLFTEHGIHVEMSTDAVIVAVVGAGSTVDVDRFVVALHALPRVAAVDAAAAPLPEPGPRAVDLRTALWSTTEVVPAAEAVGRISADSLAAYPPGVPNLLPGEVITAPVLAFLVAAATAPTGYVRGALDPALQRLRVLTDPPQEIA